MRAAFGEMSRNVVMVAPLVPPQHETVNPVRPGREQPKRWMCVPEDR